MAQFADFHGHFAPFLETVSMIFFNPVTNYSFLYGFTRHHTTTRQSKILLIRLSYSHNQQPITIHYHRHRPIFHTAVILPRSQPLFQPNKKQLSATTLTLLNDKAHLNTETFPVLVRIIKNIS